MRILITGSHGQLGNDCQQVFGGSHQVVAVDLDELDITQEAQVEETVSAMRPDVLINCAAHTGVDACESEPEPARRLNAAGPRYLAESVNRQGGKLVHISTDYVFGGDRPVPEGYREDDPPGPLSVYGKTKLEGERAVRDATNNHIIVRTAWLYGLNGHNFLRTMLRLARSDPAKQVKVVNDQYGAPTWTYRLALQIAKLIDAGAQGTYHATSGGVCTWFDLAVAFLDAMKVPHHLSPCTTAEYPTPATRPKNSVLENQRLKDEGIHIMASWQSDLMQFVAQHRDALWRQLEGWGLYRD